MVPRRDLDWSGGGRGEGVWGMQGEEERGAWGGQFGGWTGEEGVECMMVVEAPEGESSGPRATSYEPLLTQSLFLNLCGL